MIVSTTDQTSESTNNLSANIIQTGTLVFTVSDFVAGGTIEGGSTAYYATKSVVLNTNSDTIPFVFIWGNAGAYTTYAGYNNFVDYENPYQGNSRYWYTLTKTSSNGRSVLSLNVYITGVLGNLTNGVITYYRVVSANATEASGL